jgi:ornithine carbamoyltransferase
LACYHRIIAARVKDHGLLEAMAGSVEAPLLNMLSHSDHPLQALADLLTIKQLLGGLEGVRVAYVGDANNVCRSLAEGCALAGVELRIASPEGYGLQAAELARMSSVRQFTDPAQAVEGAEIVYTDVWVSMGQDSEAQARHAAMLPYQVNADLLKTCRNAFFMHCLPARRGEEVTEDVIDGPRSAVWKQAENRMHSARGAMAWLCGVRP